MIARDNCVAYLRIEKSRKLSVAVSVAVAVVVVRVMKSLDVIGRQSLQKLGCIQSDKTQEPSICQTANARKRVWSYSWRNGGQSAEEHG